MDGTLTRTIWLFAALVLWCDGTHAVAQNTPRALPPQLAFEALEVEDALPEISPLTPREPSLPAGAKTSHGLKPLASIPNTGLTADNGVVQASAKTVTTGLMDDVLQGYEAPAAESCDSPKCRAGKRCHWDGSCCKRLCAGIYQGICCNDPCYEGVWLPIADAAFFTTAVRPVTQLKLRWNGGYNVILPDRAEYFWARADGLGRGPQPAPGFLGAERLRYQEAHAYLETAISTFSVFIDAPYRSQDAVDANAGSGFGDLAAGFKTLLFDCELLQIAGQLRFDTPTGNAGKGLGTRHLSIEPSLLAGLRLAPQTYLQMQVSEWIPVDGDRAYAGSILHYHTSLNHTLVQILPDVPLIGTAEFSGYSFQDGAYTDPTLGPLQPANNATYLYAGGGLRLFIRRSVDFGLGIQNALTRQHLEGTLYRAEFRWRF